MKNLICSNCGTENEADAKFCKNCGSKLVVAEEASIVAEVSEVVSTETDKIDSKPQEMPEKTASADANAEETALVGNTTRKATGKKTFNKKWVISGVAAVIIIAILLLFSGPKITGLMISYDGATDEGVVIDSKNDGLHVLGVTEDGKEVEISNWTVTEPATLEADGSVNVEITYKQLVGDITIVCSTSKVVEIAAKYNGPTVAGTVIDESSEIEVTEIHLDGSTTVNEVDWSVKEPVTLEADETSKIEVECDGLSANITVECTTSTVTKIKASYDGNTEEGTVLNENNTGIHVTAVYKNGKKEEVSGYSIEKAKSLKAGEETKIKIKYEGKECVLKVQCSTMSKQQYKDKCKSIAYDDLARNPKKYEGDYVKFTGEVVQTMEDGSIGALRVNVTQGSYGYYDDTVYVIYIIDDENRILEDDIVTFYGTSEGLYSYESVMGATITIPSVYAKYVERN